MRKTRGEGEPGTEKVRLSMRGPDNSCELNRENMARDSLEGAEDDGSTYLEEDAIFPRAG